MGLMTNFLSLNEMFLISLQGKPILGVNLQKKKIEQLMNISKLHLSVHKNFYGMLFTKIKVKYSPTYLSSLSYTFRPSASTPSKSSVPFLFLISK